MIFIVAYKYVGNNIIGWLSIGEKGSDYCRLTTAETETTAQPMMPGYPPNSKDEATAQPAGKSSAAKTRYST
jgi:hypothetical protein